MKQKSLAILIIATAFVASSVPAAMAKQKLHWFLPRCLSGEGFQYLTITTQPFAGWRVNHGKALKPAPNPKNWVQIPQAHWIGPVGGLNAPRGPYTYEVFFASPGYHLDMKVMARWSADNCGGTLQLGSGTPVSTGLCHRKDKDYLVRHETTAQFSYADSYRHTMRIAFTTNNAADGPTGLTGVFDVVAECRDGS